MKLEWLEGDFSVAKWLGAKEVSDIGIFSFWGKTEVETSLVCKTEAVPLDVDDREDGWKGFRVVGQMEFSLVGILANISGVLADGGISIFAISTFDTDYIFVKEENALFAGEILQKNGYFFR